MISPSLHVVFNHIPQTKAKLMAGGRLTARQMSEEIASDARQAAPYQGLAKVETEQQGDTWTVQAGPWWIGFIELGSATHGSRPFLEPAADRIFRTMAPRMKIIGNNL
jgi:hypothetical protein